MDDMDLPALLLSRKMERLERAHQHLPAFAPLLHLSQTSQWSLRMLQDTLNKAHGWVEPRLHHSGFLLAVVQPDNRMVEWVDHFIFNNRHLTQIQAEYGRIWNMIYGMKELCLWIILSYITWLWISLMYSCCREDSDLLICALQRNSFLP